MGSDPRRLEGICVVPMPHIVSVVKSPRGVTLVVCGLLAAVLFLPGATCEAGDGAASNLASGGDCLLERGPGERPHDPTINQDAVLLIDSSGSMTVNDPNNCRLVVAKNYISNLTTPDRVSIVDFDALCRWTGPDHHLDSPGHDGVPDYADPKSDVNQVDSIGGTNLLCPIEEANNELQNRGEPTHLRVVILLTDGLDSAGNPDAAILAAAQQAADLGIRIFTVGFGDANVVILQQIADLTGGRYY